MKVRKIRTVKTDKAIEKHIYEKLSISEKLALNTIQVGTKITNYKILTMAPTSVKKIMRVTGLTKVPVNVKLNELEKVGLIDRERGTGRIFITVLGKKFIKAIECGEKIIGPRLEKTIDEILDKNIR